MKRNFFLIITLLILTLTACKKKDDNFTISGAVYDPYLQQNISGATVNLYGQKLEGGTLNANYNIIETATTDANGNFTFTFEVAAYSGFRIDIEKDNYIKKQEEINPDDVKKGEDYNKIYNFYASAFFKLNLNNVWPAAEEDFISYRIFNDAAGNSNCCSDTVATIPGADVSQTIICKTYGGHTITMDWNVKSGSDMIHYSEGILCPAGDTTEFTINY